MDCTHLFRMYHAQSLKGELIEKQLKAYYICDDAAEDSDDSESTKTPSSTTTSSSVTILPTGNSIEPLYDELAEIVREYRKEHGIKATDTYS